MGHAMTVTAMVLGAIVSAPTVIRSAEPKPPNIIIVFVDDQGYADLGVQGSVQDVRTPHIDKLAERGVRMTHGFVTAPQCMPSRTGLLTGRYQQHSGVETNTSGQMKPGVETIASRLKELGYVTGMSGKWGVGGGPDWGDIRGNAVTSVQKADLPLLPQARGFDEYFSGVQTLFVASHGKDGQPLRDAPQIVRDDRYRVEAQADAAVKFLQRHAKAKKPLFLYYAPYSPHAPFEAPKEYLDRFATVKNEERRTCLAMMACVDDSVGKIVSTLEEYNLLGNTLIWYISDNGAPKRGGGSNQPLNGWKGSLHDGGVRVPFIVTWPDGLVGGRKYEKLVSTLDVLPTCLAAAGAKSLPPQGDGVNLLPFLAGKKDDSPHEALYFKWTAQAAVRTEKWKLLRQGEKDSLYSLEGDPQESRDVAEKEPHTHDRLKKQLDEWLRTLPNAGPATIREKKSPIPEVDK